jgi:hypothetical protein
VATTLQVIIDQARTTLSETTASFWTDAELLVHANAAIKDLWRSIIDLYQDHVVTIDVTNMSIAANASTVTGVPADLFRIVEIAPRTLNSVNRGLVFKPRTLTSPDYMQAKAIPAIEPTSAVVYYAVINAGAPVGAPAIQIAPQLASAVPLSVTYNPVIPTKVVGDNNPIPGESDAAIRAYIIAWARARERPDREPDPGYISIYATEKTNCIVALTPRSVQEPEYVTGMWEPPAPGSIAGDW